MKTISVDVAVIGAGPSGSSVANAYLLANPQGALALVDRQRFPRDKSCGDGISPGAVKITKELGLEAIFQHYQRIRFLRLRSPAATAAGPLPSVGGEEPIGYVVPRLIYDNHLQSAAIQRGAMDFSNHRLQAIDYSEKHDKWLVRLEENTSDAKTTINLHARVVVGADGSRSKVRNLLRVPFNSVFHTGIGSRVYAQVGGGESNYLEINFLRELLPAYGWFFPISSTKTNVGIGIDVHHYKKKGIPMKQLLEAYQEALTSTFDLTYENGSELTSVLPYGSQIPSLSHMRAALVGDAASMINSATGEGIYYGMWGGARLGSLLASASQGKMKYQDAIDRYAFQFHEKFSQHFKTVSRIKKMTGHERWCNIMVRACSRDKTILSNYIDLMMGDKRHLSVLDIVKVASKGLVR